MLQEAECTGARRILYISSTSVYGHALVPVDCAVWVDEDLRPQPRDVYDRTKLAAEHLVGSSAVASTILRIARCFPEPPPVLASHLLHRAVGLDDVAAATVRAVSQTSVTGTFIIAGRYPFTRAEGLALHRDAAAVIAERALGVVSAVRERDWPRPQRIDRVYDSTAVMTDLGYRPLQDVRSLLAMAPNGRFLPPMGPGGAQASCR